MSAPYHWTPSRKAAVVIAIQKGETTREAAMAEHQVSADEIDSWIRRHAEFGEPGLCQTRIQDLRPIGEVVSGLMKRIGRGRPVALKRRRR